MSLVLTCEDPYAIDTMSKLCAWANLSPDPSTQNAACLTDGEQIIWETLAVNEFPKGVKYLPERWERPGKYAWIEHAERNALFAAAKAGIPTHGLWMIAPWAACADCARAIVQCGIYKLITLAPQQEAHGHWAESIGVAMDILQEGNVKIELVQGPLDITFSLRRNGEPFKP